MSNQDLLEEIQDKIGYTFKDTAMLAQALTHSSYANEYRLHKIGDNERLEFLGDAVLELVSSDFLFKTSKDVAEGQLSKTRASLVCEPTLAYCAREMDLGKYLRLGKGEDNTGGRERDSILSDAMEALIGAIYLDGGIEKAAAHIHRFVLNDMEHKQLFSDSKSMLQEMVQGAYKEHVSYRVVDTKGPEHHRQFVVEVSMGKRPLAQGIGRTKQAAGQDAAYKALMILREEQA